MNNNQGFPRMFTCLGCMHQAWNNCPIIWEGQFQNKEGNVNIILEVTTNQSLWILDAFFGLPNSKDDIMI